MAFNKLAAFKKPKALKSADVEYERNNIFKMVSLLTPKPPKPTFKRWEDPLHKLAITAAPPSAWQEAEYKDRQDRQVRAIEDALS
jgi:hypothetical protein